MRYSSWARTSPTSLPEWRCPFVRRSASSPWRLPGELKIPLWLDHGVRDALQDARGPLYIATPYATRLDEVATATFRAAPDDLARLGFAVAHALDPRAPSPDEFPLAGEIARALKAAEEAAGDLRRELRQRGRHPKRPRMSPWPRRQRSPLPPRNAIQWARRLSVDARSAPRSKRSGRARRIP